MKKFLFTILLIMTAIFTYGQTTYYWVGGTAGTTGINTGSNWNTDPGGLGSSRPSSIGATDILIFDGTNLGGSTPATGAAIVLASGGITCAQVKFVNNVNITLLRPTSGTSTIILAGELGEDFVIDAGSSLFINSPLGSIRFTLQTTVNACRVSGVLSVITSQQIRFENGISGAAGTFVFKNGSSFTTNITSGSSSYAFGNSSQSSEKWVVFEDGAHLYYQGGYSPMGSTSGYSAIDFRPGSVWHHRADNPLSGFGSFFNNKSFGSIIVENNATLTADGPIYRINNLTVNSGSTFKVHSSGQTAIMGNLTVNGSLTADAGTSNELILAGNTPQLVSGTGTINVPAIIVSDKSSVTLSNNIALETTAAIIGKMNFTNRQLTGTAAFTAKAATAATAGTGNLTSGSYLIKANTGFTGNVRGFTISGAGVPANTVIIDLSSTGDSIYISQPATATATAVALSISTAGATLQTANAGGLGSGTGSVALTGSRSFHDGLNYIFDAATITPFGVNTVPAANTLPVASLIVNAEVTTNSSVAISNNMTLAGKFILRPSDTLHLLGTATLTGTFGAANYIATGFNVSGGTQSLVLIDNVSGSMLIPVGTPNYYLPYTITPTAAADFSTSIFIGMTADGLINGTPFTALQKQTVVNAVWQINRTSGTATATIQLNWDAALEGSTFSTLPDTDIGIIANNGSIWSVPLGPGNNTANNASAAVTSFGSFSAGTIPQADPFVFNAMADRTYGNTDFNGGATSLNTTQPIVYNSSNTAVATIVGNNIHITGAGSTVITASQATDGFYPAASIMQPLTVLKANLEIKADNKTKFESLANPTLTATYTGFVYAQTPAALLTPAILTTTAVTASIPGNYPITVNGATSNNYNISFVNGTLTILPKQNQTITFAAPAVKTYGAADFSTGATSTNTTIPVTYTSSNTSVATVTGNIIHITGAGTTTITAMQAGSDGYFAAANVARTLTVNKANLTIRVTDTTRTAGQDNPVFNIVYTGFVLGETVASLTTPPVIITTATAASSPGYYSLTPSGAASGNYNITFTSGRLTILPASGLDRQQLFAFLNTSGSITVRVYATQTALADIVIYDMNGRFMATRNLLINNGFASVDVLVPGLISGVYAVVVKGKGVDLKTLIQAVK